MRRETITQIFYVIGVIATLVIAIRFVLPVLFKITGWLLSLIITIVIFALIIAAIIYTIARLAEMIKK
ncbi:MAG: hypothetical protein PF637_04575 [Spirochaetes bacterium]|jgi:hypothetical protein|nr:hypothetical protein [Spirochaetota bacterium]